MTTTALIVTDVQESFRQQPRWAATSNPGVAGQAGRLAAAARARGDLVIWVLHAEPGADALGRAGLLDGRRCTTHHDVQEELARRYPKATVVRDVLYVVDDRGGDLGRHRQRDRPRAAPHRHRARTGRGRPDRPPGRRPDP